MNNLLPSIYTALNLVVFIQQDHAQFTPYGDIPTWLADFLPKPAPYWNLVDCFPFLSCFLEDAEQHWREQHCQALSSGIWLEQDKQGQEVALEAYALWADQQPVLL